MQASYLVKYGLKQKKPVYMRLAGSQRVVNTAKHKVLLNYRVQVLLALS